MLNPRTGPVLVCSVAASVALVFFAVCWSLPAPPILPCTEASPRAPNEKPPSALGKAIAAPPPERTSVACLAVSEAACSVLVPVPLTTAVSATPCSGRGERGVASTRTVAVRVLPWCWYSKVLRIVRPASRSLDRTDRPGPLTRSRSAVRAAVPMAASSRRSAEPSGSARTTWSNRPGGVLRWAASTFSECGTGPSTAAAGAGAASRTESATDSSTPEIAVPPRTSGSPPARVAVTSYHRSCPVVCRSPSGTTDEERWTPLSVRNDQLGVVPALMVALASTADIGLWAPVPNMPVSPTPFSRRTPDAELSEVVPYSPAAVSISLSSSSTAPPRRPGAASPIECASPTGRARTVTSTASPPCPRDEVTPSPVSEGKCFFSSTSENAAWNTSRACGATSSSARTPSRSVRSPPPSTRSAAARFSDSSSRIRRVPGDDGGSGAGPDWSAPVMSIATCGGRSGPAVVGGCCGVGVDCCGVVRSVVGEVESGDALDDVACGGALRSAVGLVWFVAGVPVEVAAPCVLRSAVVSRGVPGVVGTVDGASEDEVVGTVGEGLCEVVRGCRNARSKPVPRGLSAGPACAAPGSRVTAGGGGCGGIIGGGATAPVPCWACSDVVFPSWAGVDVVCGAGVVSACCWAPDELGARSVVEP
ncbi:hypothetical protein GCM10025787_02650 [Saccharopolyspora rosea]